MQEFFGGILKEASLGGGRRFILAVPLLTLAVNLSRYRRMLEGAGSHDNLLSTGRGSRLKASCPDSVTALCP